MSLPFDYARCGGKDAPICSDCLRRQPGDPHYQSYIMVPPLKDGKCKYKIGEK